MTAETSNQSRTITQRLRGLGTENPSKAWLDAHYRLTDTTAFRDLKILFYEGS
jgi:hypothetical protein